jgi:Retrotransposon gag protein
MNNAVKLDVFSGRADQDPQQFLDNIELVCQVNQIVDDIDKIKTVKSWLRGKAYNWYLAQGSRHFTWANFCDAFNARYGLVQESVLDDLSQYTQQFGDTVREYADRFLSLHSHLARPIPDD